MPGQLQKMYSSQPEKITTGIKYHTKEVDQHKKKLKEKPNTPKKATTGSTKLQTPTSNGYSALLEKGSEGQQLKAGPENKRKPPPVYITDVKNISPLI
jgi:hypothetical protein